jgi:hypothetical protein
VHTCASERHKRGQLQAQAGVNEKCAPAQMWGEEHASADEEHTPAQTLMWSRARSTEVNTNILSFYKSELLAPPVPTDISQNCCHLGIVCMLDDLLLKCTCELDQNCGVPLGLCCKHGRAWKSLQVTDYALLKAMKDAADSTENPRRLCYANGATVVATAPVAPLPPQTHIMLYLLWFC